MERVITLELEGYVLNFVEFPSDLSAVGPTEIIRRGSNATSSRARGFLLRSSNNYS